MYMHRYGKNIILIHTYQWKGAPCSWTENSDLPVIQFLPLSLISSALF